jgi:N-dimethylarginine dimethylaminohydrolase
VLGEGAILLRPGAPSRYGEVQEIEDILRLRFGQVLSMQAGFADSGDMLLTPAGMNDAILVGDAFPRTVGLLQRAGYTIRTLPINGIGKLDAGLSCMSLRWQKASN